MSKKKLSKKRANPARKIREQRVAEYRASRPAVGRLDNSSFRTRGEWGDMFYA